MQVAATGEAPGFGEGGVEGAVLGRRTARAKTQRPAGDRATLAMLALAGPRSACPLLPCGLSPLSPRGGTEPASTPSAGGSRLMKLGRETKDAFPDPNFGGVFAVMAGTSPQGRRLVALRGGRWLPAGGRLPQADWL